MKIPLSYWSLALSMTEKDLEFVLSVCTCVYAAEVFKRKKRGRARESKRRQSRMTTLFVCVKISRENNGG